MRAVKSVSIDSERRVIITYLDGSTETLYPNCIWCDSEALRQLIKDLLEEKADAITQTIENVSIATFADGADEGLIKKLLVSIDPIQGGTGDPSPENIRPISGRTALNVTRCRKNLIPANAFTSVTKQGLTYTVNSDGTVSVSGTATANSYITYNVSFPVDVIINGIPEINGTVIDGTAIQISSDEASIGATVRTNDNTFVLLANHLVQLRLCINSGVTLDNALFKPMARISTDTDYSFEAYKGSTYTVNWETEAGTVYGGTLDVVSGKLIVTHFFKEYNAGDFGKGSMTQADEFYAKSTGTDVAVAGTFYSSKIIRCNYAKNVSSLVYDSVITRLSSRLPRIIFPLSYGLSSVALFDAWISNQSSPIQFLMKLNEPIEIQLTPQEICTLLGVNNIWADSGDILELEYTADTKLYIGEQQSGALGSGRQTFTIPDLQPVSEKTWEDVEKAYKEEATHERGE